MIRRYCDVSCGILFTNNNNVINNNVNCNVNNNNGNNNNKESQPDATTRPREMQAAFIGVSSNRW